VVGEGLGQATARRKTKLQLNAKKSGPAIPSLFAEGGGQAYASGWRLPPEFYINKFWIQRCSAFPLDAYGCQSSVPSGQYSAYMGNIATINCADEHKVLVRQWEMF